jgi:hypothetical protein
MTTVPKRVSGADVDQPSDRERRLPMSTEAQNTAEDASALPKPSEPLPAAEPETGADLRTHPAKAADGELSGLVGVHRF